MQRRPARKSGTAGKFPWSRREANDSEEGDDPYNGTQGILPIPCRFGIGTIKYRETCAPLRKSK